MKAIRLVPGAIALTAMAAVLPGVALADAAQAKATAAQHAGIASGQGELAAVQRHLHHVLNCLVGPDGEGFDESAGNPCAQAGGAIPQTADAEMKEKLMGVAEHVRHGVMGGDLAAAQALASEVQEMLQ